MGCTALAHVMERQLRFETKNVYRKSTWQMSLRDETQQNTLIQLPRRLHEKHGKHHVLA